MFILVMLSFSCLRCDDTSWKGIEEGIAANDRGGSGTEFYQEAEQPDSASSTAPASWRTRLKSALQSFGDRVKKEVQKSEAGDEGTSGTSPQTVGNVEEAFAGTRAEASAEARGPGYDSSIERWELDILEPVDGAIFVRSDQDPWEVQLNAQLIALNAFAAHEKMCHSSLMLVYFVYFRRAASRRTGVSTSSSRSSARNPFLHLSPVIVFLVLLSEYQLACMWEHSDATNILTGLLMSRPNANLLQS